MTDNKNDNDSQGLFSDGKSYDYESISSKPESNDSSDMPRETKADDSVEMLSILEITCILSTAFSYGCIMTTLFLITLPVECERIESQHPNMPKSIALGIFVAIAGLTQLVSPLVGMLSDTYRPPTHFELGQRMPYLTLGGLCCVTGLLGQYVESYERLWLRYGFFFFLHMIGLNIIYAMMIALIPDQVPKSQTGVANGILALLLVTGSLFGFGLFDVFFEGNIQDMYGLYVCIVTASTILTCLYAHDRDAQLNAERGAVLLGGPHSNGRPNSLILGPILLLKTMLYDPIRKMDGKALLATYSIDTEKHHDFFVVTVSRLCYYCGISVQTFFLYFLHDVIHVKDDPESAVAYLAVLGQISGAFICYPVGVASDRLFGGKRKPFVYFACAILGGVTLSMTFATTMQQMTFLCAVLGTANGIYLTMETSLAVDTLPDEYVDGPSGGNAQLLGIWGVAAFLGSAIGPMVGGPLLYLFGHRLDSTCCDEDQDYTIKGYTIILSLSSLYFLLSALSLRWVKNPHV